MKKNDLAEIKKMDLPSIKERVKKAQKEVASLVIDKNTQKLGNLRSIKNKRRDLAQMMTVIKQKQLLVQMESNLSKVTKKEDVKNAK